MYMQICDLCTCRYESIYTYIHNYMHHVCVRASVRISMYVTTQPWRDVNIVMKNSASRSLLVQPSDPDMSLGYTVWSFRVYLRPEDLQL